MSGVEIAGFVLGGFPLLISAAEHYREGFEPLLKWKRFRTEFICFIDAVDIEKQLYDQMLERFLLSANVPHEELQLFMTKRDYEGWHRADLVDVLQRHLGTSYPVYMSTINTMTKLMAELQDVLSLKNGEVDWADNGASKWDYQLKRIRLSFSKRGPKTLAALETQNRKLRELLESNEKLESMKATRKDTTWGNIFECIRRHANSLHSALKRNWCCDCTTPHGTNLQLQRRSTGGWTSNFNVAFEMQLDTQTRNAKRREFLIRLKADKAMDELSKDLFRSFVGRPSSDTQHLDLGRLRQNFENKSSPQVNFNPRPNLVTSLSDTPSTPYYMNNIAGPTSCGNIQHMLTKHESHTDKHRVWPLGRKTKPRKSVRMDLAPPLVLPTQTVSEPPSPNPELSQDTDASNGGVEIKDLCSRLCVLDAKLACLGYLADEDDHFHELVPIQKSMEVPSNVVCISLETLLKDGQATTFNRQQRHKIASVLASSLLQLQTTPWLAQTFGKQDILFYKHGSTILFDYPFVRHSFASNKSNAIPPVAGQGSPAVRFIARDSLNNLGIILLEICYGQAIEDQPFRKRYLGPDGQPHEFTNFMTARDWAESVAEQEPEWEHIIRCCISCMFEEKADWENKKFTSAVYESVVEPLEKMVMKFAKS
ncbi:uncharacterized protein PAC_18573 [Phialocephala subalpina]|uniref:DUF7580 domain-containing protein n=1 Tax=Phialocephala subalpina TaxID=576137 RepID=A0A1L7XUG8_9HELO|nr:uncharacterized protein PAC_18573 [Phialocephala subalpina]